MRTRRKSVRHIAEKGRNPDKFSSSPADAPVDFARRLRHPETRRKAVRRVAEKERNPDKFLIAHGGCAVVFARGVRHPETRRKAVRCVAKKERNTDKFLIVPGGCAGRFCAESAASGRLNHRKTARTPDGYRRRGARFRHGSNPCFLRF